MLFWRYISGNNFEKEKVLHITYGREVKARWSLRCLLTLDILWSYDSTTITTYTWNSLSPWKKMSFLVVAFVYWLSISCVFKVQHSTSWVTCSSYFKTIIFLMKPNVSSIQRRNQVLMQKFARFCTDYVQIRLIKLFERWLDSFLKVSRMTEMTKSWNAKQDYAFQVNIYNWLFYYECGLNHWIVLHYVCHVLYYVRLCLKRICNFPLIMYVPEYIKMSK